MTTEANPLREGMPNERTVKPAVLVIFGASGDLTKRKLVPAVYNLALSRLLPGGFAVVGVARRPKPDFAAEMSVPVTSWLCESIEAQGTFDAARCPGLLRRAKTADGGLLVYMACASGPCPVGLYRGGHLSVVFVEGITNARYHAGSKRSLLLAETR